jgi:peptide/nickel transport system substrate-binding protein
VSVVIAPLVCLTAAQAAEPSGSILRVSSSSDIDTLNPFTSILSAGQDIMQLEYESLVQYSADDNAVVPGMASEWSTSPDGLTWTFTLPADRVWSDGEPVTAEDAAWTITAIQDNELLQQANGGLVTNIDTAVATDDSTLTLTLKEAQASNPGSVLPIVPEHVWSEIDDPATYANDTDVVGSGPFVVKSYSQGQSVQLVTNEKFWRGAAKVDGVTYINYKNGDASVQALKTGEVDIVSGIQPAQYTALQGEEGITVSKGTGRRYTSLAINPGAKDATGADLGNGNPALRDVTLRTAIMMAIDKDTLVEKVKQGFGTAGETEIPPVYPMYFGIDEADVIPFDPAKANEILDDAGYVMGANGIRLDKQGNPLELRLLGRSSDPTHAQTAEYLKPWLKEIGIEVSVLMQSDNQVNDDSTLGKYDMYFTGWGMGPDPDFQLSINTCDSYPNADGSGNLNESNWCDPAFDVLNAAQHTELDPDKRAALVKEAMTVIYKAAANNVIWYGDYLEAYRSDRFEPFATQPADGGVIASQNGYWGFYSATPVASSTSSTSEGSNTGLVVGISVAVVVVLGAVVFLVIRRRKGAADERE